MRGPNLAWVTLGICIAASRPAEFSPDLDGGGAKLTTDYEAQSAELGIRYTFWPR